MSCGPASRRTEQAVYVIPTREPVGLGLGETPEFGFYDELESGCRQPHGPAQGPSRGAGLTAGSGPLQAPPSKQKAGGDWSPGLRSPQGGAGGAGRAERRITPGGVNNCPHPGGPETRAQRGARQPTESAPGDSSPNDARRTRRRRRGRSRRHRPSRKFLPPRTPGPGRLTIRT